MVGNFNPQELANTAWAFAKEGHAAPELFDALAASSMARVGEFNPQDLSNTAWAFATAGHAAPKLFDALAAASMARLRLLPVPTEELLTEGWERVPETRGLHSRVAGPEHLHECTESARLSSSGCQSLH